MPRPLIFGNGSMLATFDEHLEMRDFYFPYVGMEDHTQYGDSHRVGVWVEGKGMRWFSDASWKIEPKYKYETLVGNSTLRNDDLQMTIRAEDYVHPVHNVLMRHFHVQSTNGKQQTVKFFFNHDFHIYGDKQKDTAFYEPYTNSVIHYRQERYFLVGGMTDKPVECITGMQGDKYASVLRSRKHLKTCGISSFSVGKSEFRGLQGTWKDAEDGELARNAVEQGSVDSTVSIHCTIEPGSETEIVLWLCAGKHLNDVLNLQQVILEETPERLKRNCHNYWKSWVNKTYQSFGTLSPETVDLFKRSLLTIRMHADERGAIIAAADADIMEFNRDTYSYMWPRDGAFVSLALDKAGYSAVTRRFFDFCSRIQMPDGYLLHKYNPDGSLGSTWHPWFQNGKPQLPIQEDETALIVYAIHKSFEQTHDFEFLQNMYEHFVRDAGNFLVDFRETETGLPLLSYDPWEEHRGIFTYTTACTIAGLNAAANISHVLGHYSHQKRYQEAAEEMHQALIHHLYDERLGRFLKKIIRENGQTIERDETPDASICMVWKLGILSADDPRVISTMHSLEEHLTVRTPVGGIARYTNDVYHAAAAPNKDVPGNPWMITTLWDAEWRIARSKKIEDLESARAILQWVQKHASASGMLPEQLDARTGEHLSVSPLSWSHAAFVETVLAFVAKEKTLKGV